MSVQTALNEIREAMQADYDFAWSWHCNVAVASQDEGMEHEASNRAAARFMKAAFEVDTSGGPRPEQDA